MWKQSFFLWLLINFLNKRAKEMISWSERLKTLWLNRRGQDEQWWGWAQQRLWLLSVLGLTPVREARSDFLSRNHYCRTGWFQLPLCRHDWEKGRGEEEEAGCWILSNALSASTEMTIWFLSCILLMGVLQWLIFIWWTCWHPGINPTWLLCEILLMSCFTQFC